MELTILLALVFAMGFLVAVPLGPVQVEVIRRSVHGLLKPAFMVILGAFLVDIFYGVVALFGIAPFFKSRTVMSIFWLGGGVILGILGVVTVLHAEKNRDRNHRPLHLRKKRWSLLTGVTLSVTNPMMIIWWLSSIHIFRDLGLNTNFSGTAAMAYLISGGLGLATYLIIISLVINRVRDFISLRKMRMVNIILGMILLLLSGYFIAHSVGIIPD